MFPLWERGEGMIKNIKDMLIELFKSGMSLAELSSEYGIEKSTIIIQIKDVKEILHQRAGFSPKSYDHICNNKLDEVIEFINKIKHDIKTIYTILGVARSTYYKSFGKTKSER